MVAQFMTQGKRDGTTKDEPFAWQSREFLRSRVIGQVGLCLFLFQDSNIFRTVFSKCCVLFVAASGVQGRLCRRATARGKQTNIVLLTRILYEITMFCELIVHLQILYRSKHRVCHIAMTTQSVNCFQVFTHFLMTNTYQHVS